MIILNKVSLVDVAELQRVEGIVRGLNPTARVLQTDFGRVLPSDVLCTDLFDFDTAEECAGKCKVDHGPIFGRGQNRLKINQLFAIPLL